MHKGGADMSIEITLTGSEHLRQALSQLDMGMFQKVVRASAKRAATAARTTGAKSIRGIYTIKSGNLKSRASIQANGEGARLRIRGSMENITKYSARRNSRGVFVTVRRSNRAKVPRGFTIGGRFVARRGKERYPLRGIYGPAVPQLFGNPEVMDAMQERAGEIFETRVMHEISYRLGV